MIKNCGNQYNCDRSAPQRPGSNPTFHATFLTFLILLVSTAVAAGEELTFVMWKPDHPKLWDRIIKDFEQETGVKIKREIGPHSTTAAHALVTQKLKNQDPDLDVFMMDVIWPPEFASAGWVQALDEYFLPPDRADFFQGSITACSFEGRIYGVPFWTSGGLLFYRKDLLEKYGFAPPETWDQLVEQAETIVREELPKNPDIKGYSGQFKEYEGLVCNMQEFVMSNRGHLLNEQGHMPMVDSPRTLEAVRFVRDKIIGYVAPRGVLTYEEPESLHLFIQGHAVFLRNWPYAWEIANNSTESRVAGKVEITITPHFPGGKSASTLGGWQFAISKYSRKKSLSWIFIKYMTSRRTQKLLALEASQAPARISVYDDPEVLKRNPHFAKLKVVFENALPRPAIPLYPIFSDALQRFYHKAIVYPNSDVEKLAREANERIGNILRLSREAGM